MRGVRSAKTKNRLAGNSVVRIQLSPAESRANFWFLSGGTRPHLVEIVVSGHPAEVCGKSEWRNFLHPGKAAGASRANHKRWSIGAYLEAVEAGVDYAQLVKLYGEVPHPAGRYSPAQIQGTKTFCCTGDPDPKHISTSYVERQNLTMRMSMRRFTRLSNGFSKKAENHAHSVAIHFMHYNFVRIHQSLRITPAMAAGVTSKLWSLTDMVRVIEDWEAARSLKIRRNDGRLTSRRSSSSSLWGRSCGTL
jgi:hypothetical protein